MLTLEDLPSVHGTDVRAKRSAVRRSIVRSAFDRRVVLKMIGVAGVGIGLSSLDVIGKKAFGLPSQWDTCPEWKAKLPAIYGVAAGSSAHETWYERWLYCNPVYGSSAGYVGGSYCAADGYHKDGIVGSTQYNRRPYSCADRNTWVWRVNGVAPDPDSRRCSDGKFRPAGSTAPFTNSTCMYFLP